MARYVAAMRRSWEVVCFQLTGMVDRVMRVTVLKLVFWYVMWMNVMLQRRWMSASEG